MCACFSPLENGHQRTVREKNTDSLLPALSAQPLPIIVKNHATSSSLAHWIFKYKYKHKYHGKYTETVIYK